MPDGAGARELEFFLITLAFVGAVFGTAVGVLSAWRGWHSKKALVGAIILSAAIALVPDLLDGSGFGSMVGALLLAPLVAVVATGSGFAVGRGVALRLLGSRQPPDEERT
jgi:hypothetical protein